jgi:hypothetical protein
MSNSTPKTLLVHNPQQIQRACNTVDMGCSTASWWEEEVGWGGGAAVRAVRDRHRNRHAASSFWIDWLMQHRKRQIWYVTDGRTDRHRYQDIIYTRVRLIYIYIYITHIIFMYLGLLVCLYFHYLCFIFIYLCYIFQGASGCGEDT